MANRPLLLAHLPTGTITNDKPRTLFIINTSRVHSGTFFSIMTEDTLFNNVTDSNLFTSFRDNFNIFNSIDGFINVSKDVKIKSMYSSSNKFTMPVSLSLRMFNSSKDYFISE